MSKTFEGLTDPRTVTITIPGTVKAMERPRFNKRTGAVYTVPEDHQFQSYCIPFFKNVGDSFVGPVKVDIFIGVGRPENCTDEQWAAMEEGLLVPYVGGDIDNKAKNILDAAVKSGIIEDDRYIHDLHIYQKFVKDPYFTITITNTNTALYLQFAHTFKNVVFRAKRGAADDR